MFWGTFSLCLAILVFIMSFLGNRHPSELWWANDMMGANVWAIVVILLATVGIMMLGSVFVSDAWTTTALEIFLSLAVAVGTAVLIKMLGIKKKLAAYAASGQVD